MTVIFCSIYKKRMFCSICLKNERGKALAPAMPMAAVSLLIPYCYKPFAKNILPDHNYDELQSGIEDMLNMEELWSISEYLYSIL